MDSSFFLGTLCIFPISYKITSYDTYTVIYHCLDSLGNEFIITLVRYELIILNTYV
jgi:hypothetical protein